MAPRIHRIDADLLREMVVVAVHSDTSRRIHGLDLPARAKLPPDDVLALLAPGATWQHATFCGCPVDRAGHHTGDDHPDALQWATAIDRAARLCTRKGHGPYSGDTILLT